MEGGYDGLAVGTNDGALDGTVVGLVLGVMDGIRDGNEVGLMLQYNKFYQISVYVFKYTIAQSKLQACTGSY